MITENNWNSVKDKMPDPYVTILTYSDINDKFDIAYYNQNYKYWQCADRKLEGITHWKTLTKPV